MTAARLRQTTRKSKLESDSEKAASFRRVPPTRSQARAKVLVVAMLGTKAASGVPSGDCS